MRPIRANMVGARRRHQDQGFHGGLPFRGLMLGLGEFGDAGVLQVTSWRPPGSGIGSSNGRFQPCGISGFHFADLSARIALADEKMTLGICGSHNRPRHFVFTFDSSSTPAGGSVSQPLGARASRIPHGWGIASLKIQQIRQSQPRDLDQCFELMATVRVSFLLGGERFYGRLNRSSVLSDVPAEATRVNRAGPGYKVIRLRRLSHIRLCRAVRA
jgi:hypothetical protein